MPGLSCISPALSVSTGRHSFNGEPSFLESSRSECLPFKLSDSGKYQSRSFIIDQEGLQSNEDEEEHPLLPVLVSKLMPLDIIGRGASGVVRRAESPDGTIVAIKDIRVCDEAQHRQLRNELRLLRSQFSNETPHLVQYLGVCYEEGTIKLAMEYMDAGSLADAMQTAGRMPVECVGSICHQMLLGLVELRQLNLVHRDLKPQNVLLNLRGQCKLADFGCAHQLQQTEDMCNSFVGTMAYMSPERLNGDEYSYSSDIWSLSVILAECLTGKDVTKQAGYWDVVASEASHSVEAHVKDCQSEARDFVTRCAILNPEARDRVASAPKLLEHAFIRTFGLTAGFRLDLYLRELASGKRARSASTYVLCGLSTGATPSRMASHTHVFCDFSTSDMSSARAAAIGMTAVEQAKKPTSAIRVGSVGFLASLGGFGMRRLRFGRFWSDRSRTTQQTSAVSDRVSVASPSGSYPDASRYRNLL
ncbi:hypothetical protein AB1Y20_023418 [Prymnesium parvum]|uniref:mitogen-activated protein kinase kinase n=1 Tax=Prymnesium parvum TaxID=97485 RepID=A0AB34JD69_PRYPA